MNKQAVLNLFPKAKAFFAFNTWFIHSDGVDSSLTVIGYGRTPAKAWAVARSMLGNA